MADLRSNFVGIKSPNPFWLASAPPTDKEYNVRRAYEAGWGGVVWKTLGMEGPPVVNVNGPRYGVKTIHGWGTRSNASDHPKGLALDFMTTQGAPLAAHLTYMIFGALIVFFLIVEPHGIARLWSTAKEKLRLWPFPH